MNQYIEQLAKRALSCAEIDGTPEIEDFDLDNVFLKVNNQEYGIRTWDIVERGRVLSIRWTLFKMEDNHGVEITSGTSRFKI